MGLFDFLKPKPAVSPEMETAMQQIAAIAFPGGPRQIEEETGQLHALLRGKLPRDEAGHLLRRTKALLVISEDKSEARITRSILMATAGKLTEHEARLVYQFLTGMTGPATSGGDGSSAEAAVVINATSSLVGIQAEYDWLSSRFGQREVDWKLHMQSCQGHEGRTYDCMVVQLKDGVQRTVYFDISSFFGRF